MDIKKWLEDTVLPGDYRTQPVDPGTSTLMRKRRTTDGERDQESRRQKLIASDSSYLEPASRHVSKDPDGEEDGQPVETETEAGSDNAPASSTVPSSNGGQQSNGLYRRKPRRKTRLERYDIDGKKQTRIRRRDGKEQKKRLRKTKTKRKGGLATNVKALQTNGLSKNRLTLRPCERFGFLSKGRASSPAKGRGLPDLVFSEMQFLQKQRQQRDPPDDRHEASQIMQQKKSNRPRSMQNDVSRYFDAFARAPHIGKDVNVVPQPDVCKLPESTRLSWSSSQPRRAESIPGSVELPNKPPRGQVVVGRAPSILRSSPELSTKAAFAKSNDYGVIQILPEDIDAYMITHQAWKPLYNEPVSSEEFARAPKLRPKGDTTQSSARTAVMTSSGTSSVGTCPAETAPPKNPRPEPRATQKTESVNPALPERLITSAHGGQAQELANHDGRSFEIPDKASARKQANETGTRDHVRSSSLGALLRSCEAAVVESHGLNRASTFPVLQPGHGRAYRSRADNLKAVAFFQTGLPSPQRFFGCGGGKISETLQSSTQNRRCHFANQLWRSETHDSRATADPILETGPSMCSSVADLEWTLADYTDVDKLPQIHADPPVGDCALPRRVEEWDTMGEPDDIVFPGLLRPHRLY